MAKIVPLHQIDSLFMPLAAGASLRVTRFLESPLVAVTLDGPGGGDVAGPAPVRSRASAGVLADAHGRRQRGRWPAIPGRARRP